MEIENYLLEMESQSSTELQFFTSEAYAEFGYKEDLLESLINRYTKFNSTIASSNVKIDDATDLGSQCSSDHSRYTVTRNGDCPPKDPSSSIDRFHSHNNEPPLNELHENDPHTNQPTINDSPAIPHDHKLSGQVHPWVELSVKRNNSSINEYSALTKMKSPIKSVKPIKHADSNMKYKFLGIGHSCSTSKLVCTDNRKIAYVSRNSTMTDDEQKIYINLLSYFSENVDNKPSAAIKENKNQLRILQMKVDFEQKTYLEALKIFAEENVYIYNDITDKEKRFVLEKIQESGKRCKIYPKNYIQHDVFNLTNVKLDSIVQCQYLKLMLSRGILKSLLKVEVNHTPRLCPVDRVRSRFPPDCSLNKVCSEDPDVVRLLDDHEEGIDVALSMSTLQCLIDNHAPSFERRWSVPLVIRKRGAASQAVLDKPFPKQQISLQEMKEWLAKKQLQSLVMPCANPDASGIFEDQTASEANLDLIDPMDVRQTRSMAKRCRLSHEVPGDTAEENSGPTRPFQTVINLWKIGSHNVLLRSNVHGSYSKKKKKFPARIAVKLEHQTRFGYEQMTLSEVTRHWASVMFSHESQRMKLLRAQVNAIDRKVWELSPLCSSSVVPPGLPFVPQQSLRLLNLVFQSVLALDEGVYILSHAPGSVKVNIKKAVARASAGAYDLHLAYQQPVRQSETIKWLPIDTSITLPHLRKQNRIPCTFPPKDKFPVHKKFMKMAKKKNVKKK